MEAWEAYRFFEFFLKNCRNFDAILLPFVDPIIVNSFLCCGWGQEKGVGGIKLGFGQCKGTQAGWILYSFDKCVKPCEPVTNSCLFSSTGAIGWTNGGICRMITLCSDMSNCVVASSFKLCAKKVVGVM